jgi:hypothetical protein
MKMTKPALLSTFCFLFISSIISCSSEEGRDNQLTDKEKKEGWELLFNGKNLYGWHLYNARNKSSAWEVANGELACNPNNGQEPGDLVTNEEFENFDLKFDWKMGEDGNSGVFINVLENDTIRVAWLTGPEYQLLGNKHPDYPVPNERSGTMFGLAEQKTPVAIKPADQWNQSEIKQVNGKVEFYLNGVLTVEEDFKSQAWLDKIKASNFNKYPLFGRRTSGAIALQDWAKGISFRNIKIKKL